MSNPHNWLRQPPRYTYQHADEIAAWLAYEDTYRQPCAGGRCYHIVEYHDGDYCDRHGEARRERVLLEARWSCRERHGGFEAGDAAFERCVRTVRDPLRATQSNMEDERNAA
jgi:hypothetical protein